MSRRSAGRTIGLWLPVALYIAMIYTLSAQPRLRPPIQFNNSDKMYHLLEYGGLGLLLSRGFRATMPAVLPAALAAMSFGIVVGTVDETIQAYVPGRQSSGYDLMADTTGLLLAQVGVALALGRR